MPLPNNINFYEDIRHHLDNALGYPVGSGVKIICPSHGQAIHLRQRLYKLRQLDKLLSVETYDVGDPRRGLSAWEQLFISVPPKGSPGDNEVSIVVTEPFRVEEI